MISLPGIAVHSKIYESSASLVYRGIREADGRAHLRQESKGVHLLQFEQLVLDRKARQVYYCHQEIELTAKEFNLLEYFMRHPNQVLTRDQNSRWCLGVREFCQFKHH